MLEKAPATKVKNTNISGVAFFRLRRAFFSMTIPPFVLSLVNYNRTEVHLTATA